MCKQPWKAFRVNRRPLFNYQRQLHNFQNSFQWQNTKSNARQHSSNLLIKSGFGLEYIHILGSDKTWCMTILEHWTRDWLLWYYSRNWLDFLFFDIFTRPDKWQSPSPIDSTTWQLSSGEVLYSNTKYELCIRIWFDFFLFEILIHEAWQSSKLSPQSSSITMTMLFWSDILIKYKIHSSIMFDTYCIL